MQLSETAAAALPAIKSAQATNNPDKVDASLLASLPQPVAQCLRERQRIWDDPLTGFHSEFLEYHPLPPALPAEALVAARELVAYALQPAEHQRLIGEVARLRLMTKTRAVSEEDQAALLHVMSEELAIFPADVVVDALRGWARRETFFPSLAEIVEQCHRTARRRRRLAECLGINPDC
jgi:hypothetical protein